MKESSFRSDLEKEKRLALFLDKQYTKYLKNYSFCRETDLSQQHLGVDIRFTHIASGKTFLIDEKAQLDYLNDDLPTFAFELSYQKKDVRKTGWLFDFNKKTQFYALVTAIYSDAPKTFTSVKITLVNRELLIQFLTNIGFNKGSFVLPKLHGKQILKQLNPKTEGYLFYSKDNKAEQPLNLILRLDFLLTKGVAKRLV